MYFCDPHSPWQRGSNPTPTGCCASTFQGTSLAGHSPAHLAAVADELNGGPRKTLGWKTQPKRSPRSWTARPPEPGQDLTVAADAAADFPEDAAQRTGPPLRPQRLLSHRLRRRPWRGLDPGDLDGPSGGSSHGPGKPAPGQPHGTPRRYRPHIVDANNRHCCNGSDPRVLGYHQSTAKPIDPTEMGREVLEGAMSSPAAA